MQPTNLAVFWAGVVAISIIIYVILDGFDIGVGILFGTTRAEEHRQEMLNTIAPFWDGNQTWLVVIGASLFAAFPEVYAVFLGAFYIPVLLLLIGLIFRGIAFEFRGRAKQFLWLWDRGFFLGSTMIAFVQGAAVGALMRGIPVVDGQYAGGAFEWVHPFPIFTGLGMVLGYALLGAGWLVFKSDGALRDWAYARIPRLAAAVIIVLGLAFAVSVTFDAGAVAQSNLHARSWGLIFPILGDPRVARRCCRCTYAARWCAGRPDDTVLCCRLPHARRDVLAIHDSLQGHSSRRGVAGCVAPVLVLLRSRGSAGDRHLHIRNLSGVPREGSRAV